MLVDAKNIKIIMTDDHKIFRDGVVKGLSKKIDIEFIAEAVHGQDLLDKLEYLKPDMVIMGLNMPVMNGLVTLPILKEKYPGLKVIILTMYDDASMICQVIEMGANAYLLKTTDCEDIYKAIIACRKKWLHITDVVRGALISSSLNSSIKNEYGFGKRELIILKLLADGKSVEQISEYVELSERTVNAIVELLKEKAGVQNITALFDYAKHKKLI